MTPQQLQETLTAHALWLRGKGGKRADLSWSDLRRADLSGSDLRRSNLSGSDLRRSDLRRSNLREANLRWSNLRGSDLRGSDLRGSDLRRSDLSGSDLRRSNLGGSDLRGAKLPSPTVVLLCQWRILTEGLTSLAMAYDAACHPDPSAFTRWAQGGPCPYDGVKVQRACNFTERRELWKPGLPAPRPYDLMVALIRHCCADSDFHGEQPPKPIPVLCPDMSHAMKGGE